MRASSWIRGAADAPNPAGGEGAGGKGTGAGASPEREINPPPPRDPPPLRTEQVDIDNVRPGTREFELLNNPPPSTRIVLSNGNVYVTNAHGFVEEVTFQPRLVKQARDARQTAVGKQGLDSDVGGHIQACSLGGTCDRVNLFPQDANFNNSAYKQFENEIRRALEAGEDVGPVKVKFVRADPASVRPDRVIGQYSVNGRLADFDFPNLSSKKPGK